MKTIYPENVEDLGKYINETKTIVYDKDVEDL